MCILQLQHWWYVSSFISGWYLSQLFSVLETIIFIWKYITITLNGYRSQWCFVKNSGYVILKMTSLIHMCYSLQRSQVFDGWMDGFNVGLELRSGLLPTVWDSSLWQRRYKQKKGRLTKLLPPASERNMLCRQKKLVGEEFFWRILQFFFQKPH